MLFGRPVSFRKLADRRRAVFLDDVDEQPCGAVDRLPVAASASGHRCCSSTIPHRGTAVPRIMPAAWSPCQPRAAARLASRPTSERGRPRAPHDQCPRRRPSRAHRRRGEACPRRGGVEVRGRALRERLLETGLRLDARGRARAVPAGGRRGRDRPGAVDVHALRPRRATPRRARSWPVALRPRLERTAGDRPAHRRGAPRDHRRTSSSSCDWPTGCRASPTRRPRSRPRTCPRRSPTRGGSRSACSARSGPSSRAPSASTACRAWSS